MKDLFVALIAGRWSGSFVLKQKNQKFKNRNKLGRISVRADARASAA
jgi:hypothetical protein